MIFFISCCENPIKLLTIAVKLPINKIINSIVVLNSNKGEERIKRYTPAVTMVAACIKAETGVGPSIAKGNQICKPN
jgi:hypothetical protein